MRTHKSWILALGITWCLITPQADAAPDAQVDSLIALGKAQYQAREEKKAIEHLKAALKLDPEGVETLVAVGNAYFEIGQLDRAMRAHKDAMEIDDASAPAQTSIARIYYRRAAGGFLAMRNARKAVSEARRDPGQPGPGRYFGQHRFIYRASNILSLVYMLT